MLHQHERILPRSYGCTTNYELYASHPQQEQKDSDITRLAGTRPISRLKENRLSFCGF